MTIMPTEELYGLSDRGRVRENNEDVLRLEPGLHALVLADGMGGAQCGEVASAMAVETVALALRDEELPAAERLREAVRLANVAVFRRSREAQGCRGMGTTLVVAQRDGDQLHLASVGDSRAYLFRRGALRQLTQDQTVYEELRHQLGFTHEEATRHPSHRALTAAIGVSPEVAVRLYTESLEAGDTVLVCSDGLYGPVPEATLTSLLGETGGLSQLARTLVEAANARGGPDNITVGLMRVSH
jgi:protein phosphatase